ncbi:hypothetical protein P23_2545 [Acinetobacter calcoaceticus]|nr:hypothetical protein P23_2545 [Acinetobacter calcoaceticus]
MVTLPAASEALSTLSDVTELTEKVTPSVFGGVVSVGVEESSLLLS